MCLYKALSLADSLIGRVAPHSQDGVLLELSCHPDFLQNVLKVVVYDPVESFRRQAFSVFEKYFKMFSPGSGGCYRLCTVLLDIANHSGIIGYVIGKVKDVVINDLNGKQAAPLFRGTKASHNTLKVSRNNVRFFSHRSRVASSCEKVCQTLQRSRDRPVGGV